MTPSNLSLLILFFLYQLNVFSQSRPLGEYSLKTGLWCGVVEADFDGGLLMALRLGWQKTLDDKQRWRRSYDWVTGIGTTAFTQFDEGGGPRPSTVVLNSLGVHWQYDYLRWGGFNLVGEGGGGLDIIYRLRGEPPLELYPHLKLGTGFRVGSLQRRLVFEFLLSTQMGSFDYHLNNAIFYLGYQLGLDYRFRHGK